jgi:hypothetical protein
MSATGFEVFDTTVQTTNAWLKENHGGDRADCRRAYHALTAVLPALPDRLTVDEVAQTRCPVADPGSRALLRWKKLVQM